MLFVIRERVIRAKHSQFLSGASVTQFWLGTFLWDMVNFVVACFMLLIIFAAFGTEAYCSDHRIGLILLLFLLYGWASLPLMYNLSFLFSIPSSGFVWLSLLNLFLGKSKYFDIIIVSNLFPPPSLNCFMHITLQTKKKVDSRKCLLCPYCGL